MRMARSTAKIATLALTSGLLVGVAGVAPAQAADSVAGGQSAAPADSLFPNQGNSGYDVKHYDIKFKIDVGISATSGGASTTDLSDATTTITAATTGAALSSYSLDFQGTSTTLEASTLNVDSVTVDGVPAQFSRIENTTIPDATTDKHKLVVTPSTPVSGSFTTVVKYSGRPVAHRDTDNSIEGWNNTVDGATFVNQPVGSMTLFPNNNTPRDKATYTWTVDAPSTLRTSNLAQAGGKAYQAGVVSNGELLSRTPNGDGDRTTWVWDQKKQQASELSIFSIGRYDIYTSDIALASGRTIPEWTFIDPALSAANQAATLGARAQLKSLLDFYESKYGPYPGNSTGIVTDNTTGINYALETQDRPFFPNSTGTTSRNTFYHEMMHQWWGDAVAPTDWNDITLNEGPAQYSEFQFPYEGSGSSTTTTEQQNFALYTSRSASSSTFAVAPAAMTDAGDLFGEQVYEKGSFTLEALRTSIGAADFETLMRKYQETYGNGQITGRRTGAFQAMAEDISGRDLNAFFQSWWYTSGKPAWPVKFNLDVAGPTAQVNAGDPATYTVTARNTGKVAMPASGTVVKVDLADVLDDAAIGTLPAGTTLDGTILTWSVPATALAATSSITIPVTVNAGTTGSTLKPVARASTLGGTCLSCSPSLTVGTAPISPAPVPTIAGGTPTVGTPLTAATTGWADGTAFTYQWLVDGTPVPGATSATFTPAVASVGFAVTVKLTGTLAGFNPTSATSAATAVAVRGVQPVATPTISGTPKIGSRLTVDPGAWLPGTVYTYQWRANSANISGATGPAYTPAVAAQAGQTIDVVVAGTKAGVTTVSRTSAATSAVAAGDPLASTPTPTLPATAKVGTLLTAAPGSWDDGVALTYSWQLDGTNISGATAATYTPLTAQIGKALTITVTGTKPGVTAVSRVSAPVTVEVGTQVRQPTPALREEPHAGVSSVGLPGTWDTGTTLTYRWLVDGVAQSGATSIDYLPTVDQIGKALTFEVTSARAGYTTVVAVSTPSTIGSQVQNFKPTPTVDGSGKVGSDLTATPGTWDTDTTQTYQWSVDGSAVDGATELTYEVRAADLGKPVTITVTSTKPTYETVTRTSTPVTAVVGDLVGTPKPTITGAPKVGVELTAVAGDWDDGAVLTYQWFTDDEAVEGATGTTYTPTGGKVDAVVKVEVTGTKDGYTSVTKTSDPTAAVAKGDQVSTPVPTITGTPKVGVELTAVPGTWDDGADLTYQWSVDGVDVEGATKVTYTPGAARVGGIIRVAVTGTRTGYVDVTKTSEATVAVAKGDQVSTPVPTITGTPKVAVELTAVAGTWDEGTELSYQWLADGTAVPGATDQTFTPGAAQVGSVVKVAVTGTRTGYTTVTRTSAGTDAVGKGDQVSTPVPTITGMPKVGVELTAVPGTWDEGTVLTYQWLADGTAVPGATSKTFTPAPAQVGSVIKVAVSGARTGYVDVTKTSEATAAVAKGDQVSTPVPTVTGTPKVAVELTAVPGDWDSGTVLTYQWLADGTAVPGATDKTFTPAPAQVGLVVKVAVTGTRTGYTTVTRTSEATAAVAKGDQVSTPVPTITGTPKVAVELTAVAGTWDEGTDLTYQWLADGDAVDGATETTYRPGAAQAGAVITVAVTGNRTGFDPVTRTSEATAAVAKGDLVTTPVPTITGTVQVGRVVTARAGTWDAGTRLGYQWTRNGGTIRGATGSTYAVQPSDRGAALRVVVTGTKAGYVSVSRASTAAGVASGRQSRTPKPRIIGTVEVHKTVRAEKASYDEGVKLTYTWLHDGKVVKGATNRKLKISKKYAGERISVRVTAAKPGYVTVVKTSAKTKKVKR